MQVCTSGHAKHKISDSILYDSGIIFEAGFLFSQLQTALFSTRKSIAFRKFSDLLYPELASVNLFFCRRIRSLL